MSKCVICGRSGPDVAHALKLCARCVLADSSAARERAANVHRRARAQAIVKSGGYAQDPKTPERNVRFWA
jgi:hypothetical protein